MYTVWAQMNSKWLTPGETQLSHLGTLINDTNLPIPSMPPQSAISSMFFKLLESPHEFPSCAKLST